MAYSSTQIATLPGKDYTFSGEWTSSGGEWRLVAGTSPGASDLISSSASVADQVLLTFQATTTTTYISIVDNGAAKGDWVDIDNISVQELITEATFTATNVINLPADYYLTPAEQAAVSVVKSDGEQMTVASTTETAITLTEEFFTGDVFYVGIPYTMRYEMTKPMLKVQAPGTNNVEVQAVGRHQLRYMTVVYDDTAFFKVRITPEVAEVDGDPIEYPYSGRFLSTGGYLGAVPSSDGKFRFPVFAESDAVKIEILNDSPFPSNIQSISFEANYSSRSQRYG